MKLLYLSFLGFIFLSPISSSGIYFRIETAKHKVLYAKEEKFSLPISAGKTTIRFLEQARKKELLSYTGDENGIHTIANLGNQLKEISENELRAYGWCYSVNGVTPERMPNTLILNNQNTVLLWYYAYSTYKNGSWVSQCVPASN